MQRRKIVIVGGSAAGAKAAAKARRLDQQAEITIIQKDPHLSMASCGYPYYIGGTFDDRNALLATATGVVRDAGFFHKTKDIEALVNSECLTIDRERKTLTCRNLLDGETFERPYDTLALCLGAKSRALPVPGRDLHGITSLLTMADSDYLHAMCSARQISDCVIIGGGYIGVEACEALASRGIKVTLVEMEDQILSLLDSQLAGLVRNHMTARGVTVLTGRKVEAFEGEDGSLSAVLLSDGSRLPCQLAITATGVHPNTALASQAGLSIGATGGIAVNDYMQTSDPFIYAAGDCVECHNLITGRKVLAPLGDIANLQGRVVGENMALGNCVTFPGVTQTAICKVFDFAAGVSGLTERQARQLGLTDFETAINAGPDKPGFMGAGLLVSKMLAEKGSGRLLGYQCIGSGDVSRQMATASMAIRAGLTVSDLAQADLPYAPPYSLAIDHFIVTAHLLQNKLKGRLKTVSAAEVHKRVDDGTLTFLLDGRGPDEHELLRLGIGEHYIPLGALRGKLHELPQDKDAEIICFCKVSLRGYEAALVLEAHGWTNVRVMEGGIMAWPYARER